MKGLTWKQFINGTGETKEVATRFTKDFIEDFKKQWYTLTNSDDRDDLVARLFTKDADTKVVQDYIKELNGAEIEVDKLTERFDKAATSSEKFNSSLKSIGLKGVLSNGLKMAGSMLGNAVLDIAIGAALQGVFTLINNVIHASEIAIEKGKEAQSVISKGYDTVQDYKKSINGLATDVTGKTFDSTEESIDALTKKYAELAGGVDSVTNKNISLSNADYQTYLNISNQLAQIVPGLVTNLDAQGNAMLKIGKNGSEASAGVKEFLESENAIQHYTAMQNMQDVFEGIRAQVKEYNSQIEKAKQKLNDLNTLNTWTTNPLDTDFTADFINIPREMDQALPQFKKDLQEIYLDYGYTLDEVMSQMTPEDDYFLNLSVLDEKAKGRVQAALKAAVSSMGTQLDGDAARIKTEINALEAQIREQWEIGIDQMTKYIATDETFSKLPEAFQNSYIKAMKNVDLESAMEDPDFDAVDYVFDRFIHPLESMSPEARVKLGILFELDPQDMSIDQYKERVEQDLSDVFGNKASEYATDFGFIKYIEEIEKQRDLLIEKFGKGYQGAIEDLTISDMQIAYDLVVEDHFSGTFDELLKRIQEIQTQAAELDKKHISFSSLLITEDGGTTELSDKVDKFQQEIISIQSAIDSLKSGTFDSTTMVDLAQQFGISELVGQAGDLNKVLGALNLDRLREFSSVWKQATADLEGNVAEEASNLFSSIIAGVDLSNVDASVLQRKITQAMWTDASGRQAMGDDFVAQRVAEIQAEFEDELKTHEGLEILYKIFADPSAAKKTIEQLRSMYDNMELTIGLTIAQDNLTELGKQMNGLQSDASTIQHSIDLKESRGMKATVEDYNDLIENSYQQIKNLHEQNGELQTIKSILATVGADYSTIEDQINANVAAIDAARESQYGWNEAIKALPNQENEGLLAVKRAKETRNAGDNYLDMLEAAKEAQKLREQGLIGTDDFKTVAKMLSPHGMDDVDNWDENYSKIMRYLTEGVDGPKQFLEDLQQKTNDAGESLAQFNEETQTWTYNIDDVQGSADALGISLEMFLALMGRLQDYGFTNDFFSSVEEGQAHLGDLYSELAEAEAKLSDLKSKKAHGDKTVTDAVLAAQEAKVAGIRDSIVQTEELLDILQAKTISDYEADAKAAAKEAERYVGYLKDPELKEATRYQIENDLQALSDKYGIELEVDTNTGHIIDLAESTKELIQDEFDQNPVEVKYSEMDLTNRPQVSAEKMRESGWEVSDGDYDSTFSVSYSNEDGSKSVVVTPVLPDGSVLDKESLCYYANELLSGEEIDPQIQLAVFDGETSSQQADNYVDILGTVKEAVDSNDESLRGYLQTLGEYNTTDLKNINLTDGQYDSGFEGAEQAIDSLLFSLGLSADQASVLIDILGEMGLIEVGVETNLNGEETSEEVSKVINDVQAQADENPVELKTKVESPTTVEVAAIAVTGAMNGLQGATPPGDTTNETSIQVTVDDEPAKQAIDDIVDYANNQEAKIPLTIDASVASAQYAEILEQINTGRPTISLDTEVSEANLNSQVASAVEGIDPPEIEIKGNFNQEDLSTKTTAAVNGIAPPDMSINGNIDQVKTEVDQGVKYVEEQNPVLNIGVKVNYEEYLHEQLSENPDLHMGFQIDNVSDEEFSVIAANFQKIANENRPTVKVDGDTTSLDETASESVEDIASQKPVIKIDGDGSEAISEAIATKNIIESMNPVMDVSVNTDGLVSSIDSALQQGSFSFNATAHVTVSQSGGGSSGEGKTGFVSGTAYASGTGDRLWSDYRHSIGAYANGTNHDWALHNNEEALVNELGTESIVRNGKWFTIPGGAHVQALRKGDIIFNADQTKELIKYGRVLSGGGHGKVAHANGTAHNMINAYSTPYNKGSFNITSGLDEAGETIKETTKDTGKKAKKAIDDILKAFDNLMDWVKVKIERQRYKVDWYTAKSENAVGYENKNKQLSNAKKYVNALIETNTAGSAEYTRQAKKVAKKTGLSAKYQKKVQNGTIKVEELDEDTKKKVDEYKKWYDLAQECTLEAERLKQELIEIENTKLDNIQAEFDGLLSRIEHSANVINEYMGQAETKGYITSSKYYEALIGKETANIDTLKEERAALIESMEKSGIAVGSVEWHEMQDRIDEVTESILKSESAVIEYQEKIRQLKWDIFDMAQEAIAGITKESDFLNELISQEELFDERGKVTEHGLSSMGLHGVNYNTYMEQANQYRDEMKRIDAELAKDSNNKKLLDRREELLELQRESILAAEDEKQAISDLVKQGIEKELSYLQKLIDKYMDALHAQKDLYDYQNNIADQTKEISDLEKQLSAFGGDDSEEGRLKVQEIQNSLQNARKQLEETQYDKFISDQQEMLDDLYEQYSVILNQRLDNLDQLVSEVIQTVNDNAGIIGDTLREEASNVGYTLTNEMQTIWGANGTFAGVLATYSGEFSSVTTSLQVAIDNLRISIESMVKKTDADAEGKIKEATGNTSTNPSNVNSQKKTTSTPSKKPSDSNKKASSSGGDGKAKVGDKVKFKTGRYTENSAGQGSSGNIMLGDYVYITRIHKGASRPYHIARDKAGKRPLGWVKLNQLSGYAKGAFNLPHDELAWLGEGNKTEYVVRPSDGAILQPMRQGDHVINARGAENLYDFAQNPRNFMTNELFSKELNNIPTDSGKSVNVNNQVTFEISGVTNCDEFLYELQHNKKVEAIIQDMTIGRINGKSSLRKYRTKT